MIETVQREWTGKLAVIFSIIITVWWLFLLQSGVKEQIPNYLFGATYGLIALLGGVAGIFISGRWGGYKSIIGRAILFLSLGLLSEEFGQLVFSYYNLFAKIQIPYPSIADIGFFGIIPLYSLAMFSLAQASGAKFSLRSFHNKILAILIPALMLFVSYYFFLQGYKFDPPDKLKIFLDFAYPLGDAMYISLTILTFTLSRNLLGGIMRSKILFLLFAFVMQYIADFNFLYQNSKGTWYNAGYGDYLYFIAYFVTVFGILQLNTTYMKIKSQ